MAWVEPDEWYAQLATFHAAAALFITDDAGRVLLVKPNYRDHWAIPGGYVDQHETPHSAAERELRLSRCICGGISFGVDVDPASGLER